MNILFIFSTQDYQTPAKPLIDPIQIQFGISYISSFLKSHNQNTELLVLTRKTKKQSIDNFIKRFHPTLICFTAVASEYDFVSKTAKYIKSRYPSIYLLAGGPHVSLNPEKTIHDSFDALCIGEGEYPTLELVEQLEKGKKATKIKNLWIKDGKRIEKNPTREFIKDLDSLPFPDRDMWQKWTYDPESKQAILLGRGCPFQCTYCCNHALKELASGKYVRLRSPDNILKEVEEVITKFPKTEVIYFEVETIGTNLKFAIELCSKLEKFNKKLEKPLQFGINLRITPKTDYNDLFKAFKKANFSFINIGLESGSKRIRDEVLKRHHSNQDIIQTVKLAKRYGLKVHIYVMIGIPGETLADFKETIKCTRECQPDWISHSIFFPYPGTDLYRFCKEKGLLNHEIDTEMERRKAILDLPEFSKKQIQKQFNWFPYNVHKGYKPVFLMLLYAIYPMVYSNYILISIFRKITSNVFYRIFSQRLLNEKIRDTNIYSLRFWSSILQ